MRWAGSLLIGVALACSWVLAQGTNAPPAPAASTNITSKPPRTPISDEERAKREQERLRQLEADTNKAWTELSLDEKRGALDWYRGLIQLPSTEQRSIRERIDRYLHMSGEERKQIETNYERWAQMTPAERDRARQEYLRLRYDYETKWRKDHPNQPPPPFRLPATKVAAKKAPTKPKPAETNLASATVAGTTNQPNRTETP